MLLNKADVKISHLQLAALLATSALFTMTATLQGSANLSMSRFISLSICGILLLLAYAPLAIFTAKSADSPLRNNNHVLKWIFALLILSRLVYTILLTMLQLKFFVTKTIMPYLSPLAFIIIVLFVVAYSADKGVQATARVAPVAFILCAFAIVTVSFLAWDSVNVTRIYLPLLNGSGWFSDAVIEAVGNDEIFFFAVLCGFVRGKEKRECERGQAYKSILYYLPLVIAAGLWLNFLFNAVFGRVLSNVFYPMQGVAALSSLNFIERMDGVFVTAAIIAGMVKLIVAAVCVRTLVFELNRCRRTSQKEAQNRFMKIIAALILAATAVCVYAVLGNEEPLMSGRAGKIKPLNIYFTVTLIVTAVVMPIASMAFKRVRKGLCLKDEKTV